MASEFEGLTVAELKGLLRERGLPVSGNKGALIQRLEERESESESETVEEKIEFNCSNCRTRLRVPGSYQGLVTCPSCSIKQGLPVVNNTSEPISMNITPNQKALTISIIGLVLGILAVILFFSAFTIDVMCAEEDRVYYVIDGEEVLSCDSSEMLWETEMLKRVSIACCFMIPGSLILTILGYNLRQENTVLEYNTLPTVSPENNFSDSKTAKAIQATAMGLGIAASTAVILGIIIIVILILMLFVALLNW